VIARLATERALRIALAVIAVLGLAISAYLAVAHLRGGEVACVVGAGCGSVQESEYAQVLGIPVPVLGLVTYAGILLAALLSGPFGRAFGLFVTIAALAYSGWLTYVEAFILEAWCTWCVTSAILVVMATLAAIARALVGAREDEDPSAGREATAGA
jgi:uncharacterized membrane protein